MSTVASHVIPAAPASQLPVLLGGLFTTALGLFAVWFIQLRWGFGVMTWYADYVIPVGALVVGGVTASGYAIASWRSGAKISSLLLCGVLGLQGISYFAAQYLAFRYLAAQVGDTQTGFLQYLDVTTRAFAFEGEHGGLGSPLGTWGYAFRALEVAGFMAGGLVGPLLLRWLPFCEDCQQYMRTRREAEFAAALPGKRPKDPDPSWQAQREREEAAVFAHAKEISQRLLALAEKGDASRFEALRAAEAPRRREVWRLWRRVAVDASVCRGCLRGSLKVSVVTFTGGRRDRVRSVEVQRASFDHRFGVRYLER